MYKFLFIVIISFTACNIFISSQGSSNDNKLSTNDDDEKFFFSMKRTPCYGKCPTYNIIFFNDGKVIYEGKNLFLMKVNMKTIKYKNTCVNSG